MELTLLTVPACPNAAVFQERLAAALAGRARWSGAARWPASGRPRRRGCAARPRC
jgi:hypothetical protein